MTGITPWEVIAVAADAIGPDAEFVHAEYIRGVSEVTTELIGMSMEDKDTVRDFLIGYAQRNRR